MAVGAPPAPGWPVLRGYEGRALAQLAMPLGGSVLIDFAAT